MMTTLPLLGNSALIAACCASITLILRPDKAKWLSGINFFFLLAAMATLVYAYIISDFSVQNVYENSHTNKPLLYKITGSWGNHEGSIILLTLFLSGFTWLFSQTSLPSHKHTLRIQGGILTGFLCFSLLTSNPFISLVPPPANGLGLNPLLQDIGIALHPPLLYLGYTGLSLVFSLTMTCLLEPALLQQTAKTLRQWVLISWSFLTLGITMGSWWAYRELGWGGFWFWDPVENVSLLPWLSSTALLHSIIVLQKRHTLLAWTMLLGILTFSLALIGIFLVRSGVLTSVHAFANDPERGLFILFFILCISGGGFLLFALRTRYLTSSPLQLWSREGLILFNNVFFTVIAAIILLGTLYPLIIQFVGSSAISVGAPYYNTLLRYFILPLLLLAAIGPSLAWQQAHQTKWSVILPPILAIFSACLSQYFLRHPPSLILLIILSLALWLIFAMCDQLWQHLKKSYFLKEKKHPSLRFYAMFFSHIGIALLTIGVTVSTNWQNEINTTLQIDESIPIGGPYHLRLRQMMLHAKDNYLLRYGQFTLENEDQHIIATLQPEIRYYPVRNQTTTEAAVYYSLLENIHLTMGPTSDDGHFAVRIYYQPFINLVWLAGIIIALGGILAVCHHHRRQP